VQQPTHRLPSPDCWTLLRDPKPAGHAPPLAVALPRGQEGHRKSPNGGQQQGHRQQPLQLLLLSSTTQTATSNQQRRRWTLEEERKSRNPRGRRKTENRSKKGSTPCCVFLWFCRSPPVKKGRKEEVVPDPRAFLEFFPAAREPTRRQCRHCSQSQKMPRILQHRSRSYFCNF